jgi:alkylhydroperoxidase family enzyme
MLKSMKLAEALLPRDVRTRWNSTYLMLDFAVRHGEVLDRLSGVREYNLRELELSEQEWRWAVQLRDVLKASVTMATLELMLTFA